MIVEAEKRGDIKPGDTLIEPTSGNTGIALAMVAAMKGYRMILVMPDHLSSSAAVDARLRRRARLTPKSAAWSTRATRREMRDEGKGMILDQFANPDNPLAHYRGTGPEIWRDTEGAITHFVSAMGTTGTIMGVSRFLKEKNPAIRIIGAQPDEGSQIPGIRKWPEAYLPKIYDRSRVDRIEQVSQADAEAMARGSRARKASSPASRRAALRVALRIARESRTRRSCSSSAIAAIATCRPASFRRNRRCRRSSRSTSRPFPMSPACAARTICRRASDDRFSPGTRRGARADGRRFRPLLFSASSRSRARCATDEDSGLVGRERSDDPSRAHPPLLRPLDKHTPQLVSWNWRRDSICPSELSRARSWRHARAFWDWGDDDREFKFNSYLNRFHTRHLDLMDVLAMYPAAAGAVLTRWRACAASRKARMDGSARAWRDRARPAR
jgi:cysteine synthase B